MCDQYDKFVEGVMAGWLHYINLTQYCFLKKINVANIFSLSKQKPLFII